MFTSYSLRSEYLCVLMWKGEVEKSRKIKCGKIQTCRVWVWQIFGQLFCIPQVISKQVKKKKKTLVPRPSHCASTDKKKSLNTCFYLRCEHKGYDCIYFMFKLKDSRYFKHVIICYVVMSHIIWRKRTWEKSIDWGVAVILRSNQASLRRWHLNNSLRKLNHTDFQSISLQAERNTAVQYQNGYLGDPH